MIQEAFRFGTDQDMIGILTRPGETSAKRAVLCWNTGISHRIGANRINVDLARALSKIGLPVFRFDLRGHGDSLPGRAALQSATGDVVEAMNHLEQVYGYQEFVLLGLCSGAIEAHYVAESDSRVVGLCMIDTYAYRVGRYRYHYIMQRLKNPLFYRRVWAKLSKRKKKTETGVADDRFFVPFPSLESIRNAFKGFVQRKTHCLAIYTQGYEYVFNYPEQFKDMLGREIDADTILSVALHDKADHLYTDLGQRERLIDTIMRWSSERFV